jgi:hypothetical protein
LTRDDEFSADGLRGCSTWLTAFGMSPSPSNKRLFDPFDEADVAAEPSLEFDDRDGRREPAADDGRNPSGSVSDSKSSTVVGDEGMAVNIKSNQNMSIG